MPAGQVPDPLQRAQARGLRQVRGGPVQGEAAVAVAEHTRCVIRISCRSAACGRPSLHGYNIYLFI